MAGDLTGFQQYLANYAARSQAAAVQFQQQNALRDQIHTGGLLSFFTDRPSDVARDAPIRAALKASYTPAAHNEASAAIHPAVAAAMAHQATGVPVTPLTADSIKQYGGLSPAARAVLGNIDTNGVVKTAPNQSDPNAPALAGIPTFAQMMAGYAAGNGGKISLTALEALAGAAQKGAAAGSAIRKLPGIADVAGAQALPLGNNLFAAEQEKAKQDGDNARYLQSKKDQLEFLERLSRARPVDPLASYGYGGQDQR